MKRIVKLIWGVPLVAISILATGILLSGLLFSADAPKSTVSVAVEDVSILDSLDAMVSGSVSDARANLPLIERVYQIDSHAEIAPEPNQSCYGETTDPASLQWLLDEAAEILDGQETLFHTDIKTYPGMKITYYLDDTIFAITWKQVFDDFVYTISEVKIAHPSQFRRYLAGNEYGSYDLNYTSKMGAHVNAVVASSADFYLGRKYGIRVYDGAVKKVERGESVDTCYIDNNGDLLFTYCGEILDAESAQKFVDDNNVSFSVSFGPILVDDGVRCEPANYALGEVNGTYPRAAIGQRDKLHYVLVVANGQGPYWNYPTIHTFAKNVATFGCEKVYALDGGQTGVIAMNDKVINQVQFGTQRLISDIIYFATALPENE